MTPRWGTGKSDANQAEIVEALRKAGAFVTILSTHPKQLDLLVYYRGRRYQGRLYWIEVKRPGEKLTYAEAEIFDRAPGCTHRVESAEEALGIIGAVDYKTEE